MIFYTVIHTEEGGIVMISGLTKQVVSLKDKAINAWFEELALPAVPSCNMMCNFCSRDCDCILSGNNPEYLSKVMTPRQALNWAVATANKNKRVKVIKVSGPGEPLCNFQTFEVLRRLNEQLPGHIYSVSTNGLLLDDKANELARLNVKIVNVSLNAVSPYTILKLYSRIIKGNEIIVNSLRMAGVLMESTIRGIRKCRQYGIKVKVNTVYFPGINDSDLMTIASKCKDLGVNSLCIMSIRSKGKLTNLRTPDLSEMLGIKEELSKIFRNVEIKSFVPSVGG
jgi:nitrogen fixation protein NifB